MIQSQSERSRIIESVHCGAGETDQARCMSGHLGRDKARAKILERFYCKGISYDVNAFVATCERCQKTNPRHKKEQALLHPVNVPAKAMSQIGVDFLTDVRMMQLPSHCGGLLYKWVE